MADKRAFSEVLKFTVGSFQIFLDCVNCYLRYKLHMVVYQNFDRILFASKSLIKEINLSKQFKMSIRDNP